MHQPDYSYWSMLVTTWDRFLGDTSNWVDRFFYRVPLKSMASLFWMWAAAPGA